MIPGMGSGETAFKRYQEQVHQQIEEPLRRKIEHFMDHCCMEAERITETDVEELKEMAGLMDPDGQIGLLGKIEEMDMGALGLRDRQTAMTGKGIIEGYIRSTWYEENRPRSTTADAIEQSLGHFRESSYEDFIKEHPEALQKATINEENLLKRIKDLEGTIIEMKQNADKATQEINELRASRAQIVESSKAEPEIQQNTPKLIRNEYLLKFRVERTWKVSFKDENFTEVDLDHTIKVPEDYGGYLPLRVSIENEEGGRRISLTQFDIHVLDRDHYETLFNRLRSLLTEYLLNGEVDTDIPINESFGERMGFYPKLEGGDVWRLQIGKIDSRHFRGGCLLMVRLGESYLRYTMRIPREGLAIFVENISDLVEMILKSGGELKEKVG